jgi:predicted Zn-dependent protease with MMP-like domain
MARLDDANALTDALLQETPDRAEVHRARAIGWELAGNELGAERHYRRAQELDPTFPTPYRVSEATFRRLVRHSLASFPAEFTPALETVDIRIQGVPDAEQTNAPTKPTSMLVLGYFDGPLQSPPLSEQSARDAPTHIYLFKKNFERICRNQVELSDQIARTLRHEWAHYMGLDVTEFEEIDSN